MNIKLSQSTTKEFIPGSPQRDIVVMMSGGVDSSVTAMLLRDHGFNVVGITMKIPTAENCDVKRSCCGMEAGYVSRDLDIPHYYLDVRELFEEEVIQPFREAYLKGITPSPCVDCNTRIKFSAAWDAVEELLGVSNLATGHYARIIRENERVFLARGTDHVRDQSYFLYGIPAHRLPQLYLPLADYSKDEVRAMAAEAHLPVARKQDSMELCFAGEGDYRQALGEIPDTSGEIVDSQGNILGMHSGIYNYTIGQRKGLGIPAKEPYYVLRIDAENNRVVIGSKDMLYSRTISVHQTNIHIPELCNAGSCLLGKIRSQGDPQPCMVKLMELDRLHIAFDEPQFAPTPGQRLVLYDDQERVVAGGVIE